MQINNKEEIKVTILLTVLFLFGGLIHVIAGPWDFTSCITQIYYSSLVLIWAISIHYRIVNKGVRQLMLMTVFLFMQSFFFQMCRYRIFEYFLTFSRFLWYGYYITVLFAPILFLFVILHLHLQEDEKPDWHWLLMLIPSVVLILLIMTNDFHQLVFIFKDGMNGSYGTYTYGLFFYSIYAWVIVVLLLSLYLAIKKCRISGIGKNLWMPLYFSIYGILCVLIMFDEPKISGVTVWLFIESLAMVIIGMEESCIQIGFIPANSKYRAIASNANKPFIISDKNGTPVYITKVAQEMFQRTENVQIYKKPIKGGYVSWAVDLTDRMALNQEIEKYVEIIESRNEYLRNENSLKEEQARLAARNTLYNQIAIIVRPQLDAIEQLLKKSDDKSLAKIAFYNTYIKRRSNMELLKFDLKHFPTEELASAIRESCEYLKLCKIDALLNFTPECELSAEMQLFLYEAFEVVVERSLDALQFLLVNITMKEGKPALILSLKASMVDMDSIQTYFSFNGGRVVFFKEETNEMTIMITKQEGGFGI